MVECCGCPREVRLLEITDARDHPVVGILGITRITDMGAPSRGLITDA